MVMDVKIIERHLEECISYLHEDSDSEDEYVETWCEWIMSSLKIKKIKI
tara:strand:+ start:1442 stop:1588 length:147 start_codon:yes stop_codon:yes gene_type:complete